MEQSDPDDASAPSLSPLLPSGAALPSSSPPPSKRVSAEDDIRSPTFSVSMDLYAFEDYDQYGRFFGARSPEPLDFSISAPTPVDNLDGAVDRMLRRSNKAPTKPPVGAIFIHAGAGYHSVTNEKLHLEACADAARAAMRFIKTGGSAVEAVEAAIKVLEDREITNAGYGSNLTINGTVECDATIVDHLGRSGACGAVPMIKNPISLAKIIQELSLEPLSLRRVPPNLLVGDGAKAYAVEHGMALTPNERLVSDNARDRFIRWNEDLAREAEPAKSVAGACRKYDKEANQPVQRGDHVSAILTGTWNEGQPDSPSATTESFNQFSTAPKSSQKPNTQTRTSSTRVTERMTTHDLRRNTSRSTGARKRFKSSHALRSELESPSLRKTAAYAAMATNGTAATAGGSHDGTAVTTRPVSGTTEDAIPGTAGKGASSAGRLPDGLANDDVELDLISDTVGAIAIDLEGNIAAGSSSGGIGMKHRGRIGPAALAGVGTAVVPSDPSDEELVCVAAVTSGTGEHMVTSMAALKCAERFYYNKRRGVGCSEWDEDDEDAIMDSFIKNDFMGHPGVGSQRSSSVGAIGVMAVKQTKTAFYLYFGHNTESFAVCSMSTEDREPLLTMSRLGKQDTARGARRIATT